MVKAGKLHAPYIRDLGGVVESEEAAIGVLLTLEEPTQPMRTLGGIGWVPGVGTVG